MGCTSTKLSELPIEAQGKGWQIAPAEELVQANDDKPILTKIIIKVPKLSEELGLLKCSGTIVCEEKTGFWCIVLDDTWQQKRSVLLERLKNEEDALRKEFIQQADDKATLWANLLGLRESPRGFFTPPGLAPLKISMGRIEPEEKPDHVTEGKKVSFTIKGVTTMSCNWSLPVIYPTQIRDNKSTMNCPTRWYFVNVEMNDFFFKFKYPPHISVGCYGLMNVPKEAVSEMQSILKEASSQEFVYEYGKVK